MKRRHNPRLCGLLIMLSMALLPLVAESAWDFSKSSIAVDEIISGGPPRDGIPALNAPTFVPASQAGFMGDDEQVLGVFIEGVARAYPTRILSWHELVNDRFRDLPVLVSW